jgi:UDP-N-acetylmuramoylalanine--D-glutamate ligase
VTWVGEGYDWHLEPEGSHSWLCHGDQRLFSTERSTLIGEHNHRNMLLALAGASATGALDKRAIEAALGSFEGLANRLEHIHDASGVVFINDSLATNPHAAAAALESCSSPGMVWLVGGFDRGVDYTVLVERVVATTPRHILGLPGSGPALVELFRAALEQAGRSEQVILGTVESMSEAVSRARELAGPGDYVLLSPGAPSFGYYRDYQHRADDFRAAIETTQPKDPA